MEEKGLKIGTSFINHHLYNSGIEANTINSLTTNVFYSCYYS